MTKNEIYATKRIISRLSKMYADTKDKSYALAIGVVSKANPEAAMAVKNKSKNNSIGSFDRWANGNQYGSFNSDED
jgi:hypothetical protein